MVRAEASADRLLAGSGPWLQRFGHLLHMPSHLFVRLGRYADAAAANVAALAADRALSDACQAPYEPEHNAQMLVWAANMAGQARARAAWMGLGPQCPQAGRGWRACMAARDSRPGDVRS